MKWELWKVGRIFLPDHASCLQPWASAQPTRCTRSAVRSASRLAPTHSTAAPASATSAASAPMVRTYTSPTFSQTHLHAGPAWPRHSISQSWVRALSTHPQTSSESRTPCRVSRRKKDLRVLRRGGLRVIQGNFLGLAGMGEGQSRD